MKKKSKTPFLLRIIPSVFPLMERFMPALAHRFFAFLFFTPMGYPTPEKELKSEIFAAKFILRIHGMRIQCYRWGQSPKTVLVVHGWAGRATQFRRLVKPFINQSYQVVGFDGPAHGKSSGLRTNLDEFVKVIHELNRRFTVVGMVAHSFGGVASLYAVANGLPVKNLVNIASPTIAAEIIQTYLKAIGGSHKTGQAFQEYIARKYGKPFESFSSLAFIRQVPPDFNLLLVHDADDPEVSLNHPQQLIRIFPRAQLYQTSGLGHTRILRDDTVIGQVVTFIHTHSSESKN